MKTKLFNNKANMWAIEDALKVFIKNSPDKIEVVSFSVVYDSNTEFFSSILIYK